MEIMKHEIKLMSINFSKRKSRERNNRLQSLEKRLKQLYEQNADSNSQKINEIENEIQNMYDVKAHGAQVRSRVQILEEGEKNTKIFLNLEKSRQNRKNITSLSVDGKRVNDPSQILNEEVKFYKNLYTSNKTVENHNIYLNETTFDHILTDTEGNACEGPISINECLLAINGMKTNKSPGLDGLTVEFYQKISNQISPLLHKSICQSYDKGELTRSQKQSIFSLIFKKGNPEDLENWRPISLLNVDYKIIARVLALRLQNVLPSIISMDQQGFIKNRFIGYNIRQIQDIIDYAELVKIDGAILFLDFKKAFDTLEWDFLLQVLCKFGFKANFINWVKLLYNNICSSVINNGWISQTFDIKRGVPFRHCSLL